MPLPKRHGSKILIAMAVLAGFEALFFAAAWWAGRNGRADYSAGGAALAVGCFAFLTSFYFLSFASLGERPLLLCSYLFLVDLGVIGLTLVEKRFAAVRAPIGVAAFSFLGIWTAAYLTNQLLAPALVCYFAFALFHSAAPLLLRHFEKRPACCHSCC